MANTHVGVANHPDEIRDVLPLPVPMLDKHEDLILRAMRGGALSDIRHGFPRTLPLAGRAAWIFLLIVVLNTLHLGWSPASRLETELGGPVSAAQQSSLTSGGPAMATTSRVLPEVFDSLCKLCFRRVGHRGAQSAGPQCHQPWHGDGW